SARATFPPDRRDALCGHCADVALDRGMAFAMARAGRGAWGTRSGKLFVDRSGSRAKIDLHSCPGFHRIRRFWRDLSLPASVRKTGRKAPLSARIAPLTN